MSTAESFPPGRSPGKSPGLTLDLGSKNPFRNRTTSPANDHLGSTLSSPAPTSPFDDPIPPGRPLSTNPFLDPALAKQSEPPVSPLGAMSTQSDKRVSPTAEELFDSITLEDGKPKRPSGDENHGMNNQAVAPRRNGPTGPGHRPTASQEEAMRARRMQGGGSRRPDGPSQPPHRRTERRPRPRRNSDSSLLVDIEKPLTEEEKKARDARRRERERRHRPSRPSRKVDLIDQLDMTSVYGIGAFHHDGPFDACNPHRNRKGSRRAPMSAFAKDSLNNSIGGAGPVNARPDHKRFMGTADEEAFKDYAGSGSLPKKESKSQPEDTYFDPTSRGEILHGDESLGLGTSTFLEGTPAAQTIIQRRNAEQAQEFAEGGIQRKKSLAQRIRGVGRGPGGRPSFGEGARRPTYPELRERPSDEGRASNDPSSPNEEYKDEPETTTTKTPDGSGTKSPTSPGSQPQRVSNGLERRATADGITPTEDSPGKQGGGGFLARVKSLKGGPRKPRAQEDTPNAPAVPETAV